MRKVQSMPWGMGSMARNASRYVSNRTTANMGGWSLRPVFNGSLASPMNHLLPSLHIAFDPQAKTSAPLVIILSARPNLPFKGNEIHEITINELQLFGQTLGHAPTTLQTPSILARV